MPLHPSANETKAINCAQLLTSFITNIRYVEPSTSAYKIINLKIEFNSIKTKVDTILNIILEEGIAQKIPAVKSYYYLYFLQNVSRLNQYFNYVESINDERESQSTTLNTNWLGLAILKKYGIAGFNHILLAQQVNIGMRIKVSQNKNVFRDAYLYDDEGRRYYYDLKKTPATFPHQDRTHYSQANLVIGRATQKSNLSSFFKGTKGQAADDYYKLAYKEQHEKEQELFKKANENIQ